jgi:hypothetical protein
LHHGHDVVFAHHHQLITVNLDGLASVFAEQNAVAHFQVNSVLFASVVAFAGADGEHFTLIGLLGGGVGDYDAGGGLTLFLKTLNDHAIVQGAKFHCHEQFSLNFFWVKSELNRGLRQDFALDLERINAD